MVTTFADLRHPSKPGDADSGRFFRKTGGSGHKLLPLPGSADMKLKKSVRHAARRTTEKYRA
jgi:hypothetical protein